MGGEKHLRKKTTNYASELLRLTIAARESGEVAEQRPKIRKSIAPTPAPPLEELLAKKRRL